MGTIIGFAITAIIFLIIGVLVGNRAEIAIEDGFKKLENTIHERLAAIESAIRSKV